MRRGEGEAKLVARTARHSAPFLLSYFLAFSPLNHRPPPILTAFPLAPLFNCPTPPGSPFNPPPPPATIFRYCTHPPCSPLLPCCLACSVHYSHSPQAMAATMSSSSMAAVVAPSLAVSTSTSKRSSSKLGVRKLKNFSGLQPESQVTRMGMPVSTEEAFANIRARWSGRASRGGALSANCDVASEIFRIVPIMSGLTLVGIAIGFVLLRVEAAVEESE